MSPSRRIAASAAALALVVGISACGGGSGDAGAYVSIGQRSLTVASAVVVLSGTASLPEGSERAGGTPTMPIVTCQLGPHTMRWSNATSGASGNLTALWNCGQDWMHWSTVPIPLVVGPNAITVTLGDASGAPLAQDSATVVRN